MRTRANHSGIATIIEMCLIEQTGRGEDKGSGVFFIIPLVNFLDDKVNDEPNLRITCGKITTAINKGQLCCEERNKNYNIC